MSRKKRLRAIDLPTNIGNFRPRIMGVDSRIAVGLVITASSAALAAQFSWDLAAILATAGFLSTIPVRENQPAALLFLRNAAWRMNTGRFRKSGMRTAEMQGRSFIVLHGNTGLPVEVSTGEFHTLPLDMKEDFIQAVGDTIATLECSFTAYALPYRADFGETSGMDAREVSEDYNSMVRYLASDLYYYRTVIILWTRSGGDGSQAAADLSIALEKLQSGLSGIGSCTVLDSSQAILDLADEAYMSHELRGGRA